MPTDAEFAAFVGDYQDMVFSVALRLVGNPADAEDISQEVFLQAFRHFDELRDSPTKGGWLKTTARNRALNHLQRYRNRWKFFSELGRAGRDDDEDAGDIERHLPAGTATAAVAGDDVGVSEAIEAALARLPDKFRIPLVLYHFENLPYEEIARLTKVSLSKVKTDIARGRERLRQHLGPLNELA
jgi:RNA polymerase sigma-70 factor, ECF subfamily